MPVRLAQSDAFPRRHIGPNDAEIAAMLAAVGVASTDELVARTVPAPIRLGRALDLPAGCTEHEWLDEVTRVASQNQVWRSYLGTGYSDCFTPPVLLRNILENPGWYTQYTPYQAEIAQGRLEALLNFQTMIADLTALEVANASLLDEATAAAEAMHLLWGAGGSDERNTFFVSDACHPQTIAVVAGRGRAVGIDVVVGDERTRAFDASVFGVLVQYPATDGEVRDPRDVIERAHAAGARVVIAADLLALTLLAPPGELGADVAVGSAQRFGVPLGYGGPHAAFLATRGDLVRRMPGRIIGVTRDAQGRPALRMALQTREQHIRRERATSNICTAQALLAIVAGMYAVWHGPDGLRDIAERVHGAAAVLAAGLGRLGWKVAHARVFDTVRVDGAPDALDAVVARAAAARINLRRLAPGSLVVALDETTRAADVAELLAVFAGDRALGVTLDALAEATDATLAPELARTSRYLAHPVFHAYRSETEMLRYVRKLEGRDLSLTHGMIPLGSCTMKLNATAEMMPITWPAWGRLHPFAPREQAAGYAVVFRELEAALAACTGFPAVSLQPNAGSQGEYAGLLVIRAYHESRGDLGRDVCLIPQSAHGTNPASAVMAGMRVVVVACDAAGNVDVADLEAKAREHGAKLAALMVTYPSTHGVFEAEIKRICATIHEHGGQVYMDGANMNAQVGLCRPGDIGADVCHINLHKTFCIPHGGGGPGMGPIAVASHLAPFLPGHPVVATGGASAIAPIAAAPWGSASILLISWAYVRMMGADGLRRATEVALLSANYIARRLDPHFPVVYRGEHGMVAHECIVDLRAFKKSAGIEAEDVAKRLMDYGFHAPTMSFPIAGTLMIEPTESESLAEIDRFCEAMIAIRGEIAQIEAGALPRDDNPLKHAPHTAEVVTASAWSHAYSREVAAFPTSATRARKFWPAVARIDNAYGDRNLVCTCPPVDAYGA